MGHKEEYQRKIEEQLGQWKKQIDALGFKAGKVEEKARLKTEELLSKARKDFGFAETRLKARKTAGVEGWEKLRTGLDSALRELKTSFGKAETRVQEDTKNK